MPLRLQVSLDENILNKKLTKQIKENSKMPLTSKFELVQQI